MRGGREEGGGMQRTAAEDDLARGDAVALAKVDEARVGLREEELLLARRVGVRVRVRVRVSVSVSVRVRVKLPKTTP